MITPFINSFELIADGPALAARMRRDGYLFLPGLLPRDDITEWGAGSASPEKRSMARIQPLCSPAFTHNDPERKKTPPRINPASKRFRPRPERKSPLASGWKASARAIAPLQIRTGA